MVMNWPQPDADQLRTSIPASSSLHRERDDAPVVGDRAIECGAGSVTRIPPNVVHYGEPAGSEAVLNLDVFSRFAKTTGTWSSINASRNRVKAGQPLYTP
jgi:hypothetical protein